MDDDKEFKQFEKTIDFSRYNAHESIELYMEWLKENDKDNKGIREFVSHNQKEYIKEKEKTISFKK